MAKQQKMLRNAGSTALSALLVFSYAPIAYAEDASDVSAELVAVDAEEGASIVNDSQLQEKDATDTNANAAIFDEGNLSGGFQ